MAQNGRPTPGADDGARAGGGADPPAAQPPARAARTPAGASGSPTLAEIARQAGVSVPTVSKVLHGRSDVAARTRAKVQRLLEQHGYLARRRPTPTALAPGGLIDFVINELDGPWAVALIRGAEDALHEVGMGMVVSAARGRERHAARWLDSLAGRGTRGAILVVPELTDGEHEELRRLGIPYALIAPVEEPPPGVPWVGATNWPGGLAATRHLVRLGHRRIAVIGGPPHRLSSRARVDGYRSALDEAGLPFDPALVRYGDFTHEPAHRHALDLLRLPEPPTAIFAGSDQQALSTYRAAAALGLRVPHDLSVVGFDDLDFADWVTPRLTTVRTPLPEMAGLAARMVLRMLAGERPESTRVEVASELVVRDSTCAPR
ncbi:LacI family DNA-binding transcriptional regulator [Streptomyces sp. V4-01]|uniref:LacI family DNA-binding transcriptional regulator n=1 Tax=Actinacidiphila polyblastidii TaxID=3110430 RepID=A0ABU7PFU2_9ACTN|nr:LacI family DNA-binding transcriptional regulator [Streptomyces sp. V4-01]